MIPVFAYILFKFDIFFVVKAIWKTHENWWQKHYIDPSKYYQQSLSCLASSANKTEKENIRKSIHLVGIWLSDKRGKKRVLSYLSQGKGEN